MLTILSFFFFASLSQLVARLAFGLTGLLIASALAIAQPFAIAVIIHMTPVTESNDQAVFMAAGGAMVWAIVATPILLATLALIWRVSPTWEFRNTFGRAAAGGGPSINAPDRGKVAHDIHHASEGP